MTPVNTTTGENIMVYCRRLCEAIILKASPHTQYPSVINWSSQFGLIPNRCIPFKASIWARRFRLAKDTFHRRVKEGIHGKISTCAFPRQQACKLCWMSKQSNWNRFHLDDWYLAILYLKVAANAIIHLGADWEWMVQWECTQSCGRFKKSKWKNCLY